MSDEERYLDAKERDSLRLDPHEVAATMYDHQRMAEEGRPPLRMVCPTPDREPFTTIEQDVDKLVALALKVRDQRDELRRELALILEHVKDIDRPMFHDQPGLALRTLIKFVRAAAERGLK